jgi:hypothetical protein
MDRIELDLELLKKMYPVEPEETPAEIIKKDKLEKEQAEQTDNPLLQEQVEDCKGWAEDIKLIIQQMFGKNKIPVTVKGQPNDVASLADVLKCHKNFIEKIAQYGVNHILTWKDKALLKNAISEFEKNTKIKYPFHV